MLPPAGHPPAVSLRPVPWVPPVGWLPCGALGAWVLLRGELAAQGHVLLLADKQYHFASFLTKISQLKGYSL